MTDALPASGARGAPGNGSPARRGDPEPHAQASWRATGIVAGAALDFPGTPLAPLAALRGAGSAVARRPGRVYIPRVRIRLPLAITMFAVVLLGCGYTWVGATSGQALGRVVVVTPENASGEGGLELVVADALRREVLRRADAELVEDRSRADWIVTGRVLPLEVTATSFSSVVLALEYQLTLALDLRARDAEGAEVAPGVRVLRDSERYLASADVEALRKNRQEALRRVSQLLAARFLDALAARRAS